MQIFSKVREWGLMQISTNMLEQATEVMRKNSDQGEEL